MSQSLTEEEILGRVREVRSRLNDACTKANRNPEEVTLVAVVKTFGPEVVRAAYNAGIRDFGESYAQDLRDKANALSDLEGINWHFIGRIQTNKVKYLAGRARFVHSIDKLEIAQALDKKASSIGASPPDVMVNINLGDETTKSGINPDELTTLCEGIIALPNIRLCGLMCLPPWSEDPENSRGYFRKLRELGKAVQEYIDKTRLFHLSMGMSHDLEVAIEEGATMVRVGTDLFGTRA